MLPLFALLVSVAGPPEDSADPRRGLVHRSPYGAVDLRLGEMDGRLGVLLGAEIGLVARRHLIAGVAGHGLVAHDRAYAMDRRLGYGQVGVWLGLYSLRWRPVYGGLRLFLGGAYVCLHEDGSSRCDANTGAFTSTPEAGIYVRMGSLARLAIMGGYRFVVPGAWSGPKQWPLSGGEASVRVEVGRF